MSSKHTNKFASNLTYAMSTSTLSKSNAWVKREIDNWLGIYTPVLNLAPYSLILPRIA